VLRASAVCIVRYAELVTAVAAAAVGPTQGHLHHWQLSDRCGRQGTAHHLQEPRQVRGSLQPHAAVPAARVGLGYGRSVWADRGAAAATAFRACFYDHPHLRLRAPAVR
jgi:hypothetical protein